jgi:hypothetical protein
MALARPSIQKPSAKKKHSEMLLPLKVKTVSEVAHPFIYAPL